MTTSKMYAKIEKILDKNPKAFYNNESGTYFTMDGYVAYHIPDMQILSTNNTNYPNMNKFLLDLFSNASDDGKLARIIEYGIHPAADRKIRKLSADENLYAFIKESLVRDFPKNTLYYVSGSNKPVLAGIWENGVLYPFAIVMPVRLDPELFESQSKDYVG